LFFLFFAFLSIFSLGGVIRSSWWSVFLYYFRVENTSGGVSRQSYKRIQEGRIDQLFCSF
jgi:hypothetical protein